MEHNDVRLLSDDLLDALGGAVRPPARPQLGDLADALAKQADTRVVIVFDDVHHLTNGKVIGGLTRFLEQRPDNVFVVVSGRDESTLPLRPFRARGQVIEIVGRDLAFTPGETSDLLAHTFRTPVSQNAADRLCAATEGWATGLCLAGHALRGSPSPEKSIGDHIGRNRHLDDFIDSEVLDRLPTDRVRFLENTSLIQHLDPELCNRLTGRSDSAAVLADLVDHNLFTEEIASSPPQYRYHALFAESLATRVTRMGSEHVTTLLTIASEWYEEKGAMDLAIDASLRAGDMARAERLIRIASGPALRAGLAATVVRWLSALPAESFDADPELTLLLARAGGSSGDLVLGRSGLACVERIMEESPDEVTPAVRTEYHGLAAIIALWTGDFVRARAEMEQAKVWLAHHPGEHPGMMHGIDRLHLDVLGSLAELMNGELERAVSMIDAMLAPGHLVDPEKDTVLALGVRSLALAWHGERDADACRFLEANRSRVIGYRGRTGGPFVFFVAGAWAGDLDLAGADLGSARSIAHQLDLPAYLAVFGLADAKYALRTGRWSHAEKALDRAEAIISEMPAPGFLSTLVQRLRAELEAASDAGTALTDRELAVLRELATGASRREVAERNYLSVNTVKTHLRTAYRKLGATNRADAIERARVIGLLDRQDAADGR